jgi:dihydro-heme d1 dehydrogenase
VAALKDVPEIWEISTDPNADPIFEGMVHSHEKGMVEGLASSQGLFALRRIAVEEPLDDFFFDKDYRHLFGSTRGGTSSVVVNLNVGRPIARLALEGFPHLGSGISWTWEGRQIMATPHLRDARVSIIDMENWSILKTIETDGPGFFMRSHEKTPYAWVDVFFGPNKDEIHIIDKRTLEIVRTLKPEPGKTVAHVEFTRDGAYALVSIWEMDGAVIVYDARTFEEVRRIPMVKPSGKYNVFNKITFSAGTSH